MSRRLRYRRPCQPARFLEALRIPNDEMISNTPMTTNHAPTTIARVTMDWNGDARTTMPASRLITPTKMFHPRPGRCGSLTAEIVVATPRKMNPMPIQMASSRIAYTLTEMTECEQRQDQRRGATDEQQDPAARRDVKLEREDDLRDTGDQR